jgi:hypothetical protein
MRRSHLLPRQPPEDNNPTKARVDERVVVDSLRGKGAYDGIVSDMRKVAGILLEVFLKSR